MINDLFSICIICFYCLACLGFGHLAVSAIQTEYNDKTQGYANVISTFILGQAILAAIWVPISLLGQLNVIIDLVVLLIGFIIFLVNYKTQTKLIFSTFKIEWKWLLRTDISFRIICFGLVVIVFLFFLSGLYTGPLGDAEAFYMAYPKVIADSGRLTEMPGLYSGFSQIGLMTELHFSVLMQLGVAETSKLFVWPVAISAGLILTAICTQVGLGKRGQWVAVILLFTSTGFTNHIWDGKVDVPPAALALAAVYWIIQEERISETTLRLIGLFSGFAMVAKFSYIPILIPSFFILISWRLYLATSNLFTLRQNIIKLTQYSFTIGIWVLLAWAPHLIKNWVLFDAPLAPFIGVDSSILDQVWFSSEDTSWILKTYPLALIFGRYPMQGGNLSFLWLAFLPLVFFLPKTKSFIRSPLVQITVTGIIGVAIWMLLRPSVIAPRYIFISLALLIPMVAWGVEQLYEKENRPYFLRITILIATLLAFLFISYPHIKNTIVNKIRNSDNTTDCALAGGYWDYCESFKELNDIVNLGGRMYFAGYYGYWARSDMLQCQLSRSEMMTLDRFKDVKEKWLYLLERGVNYVVVDRLSHAEKIQEFSSTLTPSWLSSELIMDNQKLMVWKIQAKDHENLAKVKCHTNKADNWKVNDKSIGVRDK
jgi:hypothetical protein